jgi:4-amino-4-deoxy-L-arabinose transferase-like glycosyltransferase
MSDVRDSLTAVSQTAVEPWRWALLVVLLIGAYFAVSVFDHDVWSPTEPAVAGVVWEMYRHNQLHDDLAVPRINGLPYLEKPPLYYWAAWACCKAGGRMSAGLLRLPAVTFGILCLFLAFWAARARYGAAPAWLATILAATTPSFYLLSHRATADMAAAFFSFLCFALFVSTLSPSEDTPKRHPLDILFALALAFSFYSKNFYTWLIVLPPVLLFLAYRRLYRRIGVIVGLLAVFFVLVMAPWCLAVFRRGGWEYLRTIFVDNTLGRFFSMAPPWPVAALNDAYRAEKDKSRLIYLATLFVFSAPWTLAFIASLAAFFRKRGGDFRLFLKIAFVMIPVVLTLSSSRVGEYAMPIYFVTILMTAELMRDLLQETTRPRRDWKGKLVGLNVALVIGVCLAAPVLVSSALRTGAPLLGLIPALAVAGWLAVNRREKWLTFRVLSTALAVVCGAFILVMDCITPQLDQQKSFAYFFNAIRPAVAQRTLYSAFCDDRRLPLISYYLDRRARIVNDDQDIFKLLRSGQPLGIIIASKFYRTYQGEFARIPHRAITTTGGQNAFTFVAPDDSIAKRPLESPPQRPLPQAASLPGQGSR